MRVHRWRQLRLDDGQDIALSWGFRYTYKMKLTAVKYVLKVARTR